MRWIHEYGPELEKRIRPYLKQTTDSWRVDETYISVKGQWKYLYRAVDSKGATVDFLLRANRDISAAKRFFLKALSSSHNQMPRVITVDKNPSYPPALQQLMSENALAKDTLIRQAKYLNNIVEQDHRLLKKITKPMLGFHSFPTAERTLKGIEAMHMIWKRQVEYHSPVSSEIGFIHTIFGLAV